MFRPLYQDIGMLLAVVALGTLAFVIGRSVWQLPRYVRWLYAIAMIGLMIVAGLALWAVAFMGIHPWLVLIGGARGLLLLVGLSLLGAAWGLPGRSFSSGFLASLVAIAALIFVMETNAGLYWRFFGPAHYWDRRADVNGCLRQATGFTCSPAAAVMYLHWLGVDASEGEMAYLAGTSVLGTDTYAMAAAIREKLGPDGEVVVRRCDYDDSVKTPWPFMAHVQLANFMGHSLFVIQANPEDVVVRDPLSGAEKKMSRSDFEAIFEGTTTWAFAGRMGRSKK